MSLQVLMETDPDWAPSLRLGRKDVAPTDTACSERRSINTLQADETRAHKTGNNCQLHTEEGTHDTGHIEAQTECNAREAPCVKTTQRSVTVFRQN